jgi:hypothetical protein
VQYAAKGESFSASSVNVESDFDVISGDSATVAEVTEKFGI